MLQVMLQVMAESDTTVQQSFGDALIDCLGWLQDSYTKLSNYPLASYLGAYLIGNVYDTHVCQWAVV